MKKTKIFLMFFIIPYVIFLFFSYSIYRLNNNFLIKSFEKRNSEDIIHLGDIYRRALLNIAKTEPENTIKIIKNSFFDSKDVVYFAVRKAKDELLGWGTKYEGFLPIFDYYPKKKISLRKIKTPVGIIFELNIKYKVKAEENTLTLGIKRAYGYIAEKIYLRYLLILDILIALLSFLYYKRIVNYNEYVINKEKFIEQEKREKEYFKTLSVLYLGISHELRNPLNILSLILEKMKISYKNHEVDKDIEEGKKEIDRILRVIDGLHLLVEQTESKGGKREKWKTETFNIAEIVKESMESLKKTFSTDMEFCDKTKGDNLVCGNKELTLILLNNLIKNSCEASGDDGIVRVCIDKRNTLFIEIKDTGGGLDHKSVYLKEPFSTNKIGHLGIGLFIVKKIIEYHGWKLEFNNYELGSIIRVYLNEVKDERKGKDSNSRG